MAIGVFDKAGILLSSSSMLSLARIAGALAGFAAQVLLARVLQASALGVFYSVTSLAAVAGLAASHGYPAIMPRFVARYRKQRRPGLVAAFLSHARAEASFYVAVATTAVALFAVLWPGLGAVTRLALLAAACAIPANAALRINGSMAGAIRRFALAYLPDTCIRPFLLLGGIVVLIGLGVELTASNVTWLLTAIFSLLALFQFSLLERGLPDAAPEPVTPRRLGIWSREATPLIPVVLFTSFFADVDILIVTPLLASADTGAFGVCLKLALLVGFAVQVAQQVVVPDLADAHAQKSFEHMPQTLLKALFFPLAVTLGALGFVLLWGGPLLALFGPEFVAAKPALAILIGSQLLRAVFGPNIGLLTVIGAQRENAALAVTAMVVLALGNLLLAPLYGVNGAALAVLIATLVWMVGGSVLLNRLAGLRTDAWFLLARGLRSIGRAGSG